MSIPILDAHNHLQDARFDAERDSILKTLATLPVQYVVVNGTHVADWENVAQLAGDYPWIIPSYGLHPWFIDEYHSETLSLLCDRLKQGGAVGEIGLDRWKEGLDFEKQKRAFLEQMHVAVDYERPVTIHCLKAWGALMELLPCIRIPSCGFLLHSYSGPRELIKPLTTLGAYFSFSGYFLLERKRAVREVFQHIPKDRLLIETDAPDMELPPEKQCYQSNAGNHPANIAAVYQGVADGLNMPVATLAQQVLANFKRLFAPVLGTSAK